MTTLQDIDTEILELRETLKKMHEKQLRAIDIPTNQMISARLQAYSTHLQALATLRLTLTTKD